MPSGFFEVRDESDFFGVLERVLEAQKATDGKRTEDLLLLVLGLTHLVEWIAPTYKKGDTARNSAERFAVALFDNESYQTVRLLANHAKHQRRQSLPLTQTVRYVETLDDRDTPVDSWLDLDGGPPSVREYGSQDLLEIFRQVDLPRDLRTIHN